MATCPNCGNETSEGAVFCDKCGTRLPEAEAPATPAPVVDAPGGGTLICPACGAGNVPGEAFCDYCGTPLEAPAPMPAPATTTEPAAAVAQPEAAAPVAPEEEAPTTPELPPMPEASPVAAPQNICPACGAAVLPNEAFCANCGASLAQAPIPPEPVAEAEVGDIALPEEDVAPPPPPEPAAAAEPVAPPAPVDAAAPAAGLNCPACGAEMEEGDVFCSACGFALQPTPMPATQAPAAAPQAPAPAAMPPAPAPTPAARTGARLVVSASGAELPLPAGDELMIGREDPVSGIYPEVDLTPHGGEEGGVSRRHARIVLENGEYYIEDLDSTNFTFVNKQRVVPKTRQRIVDGDEIRAGRVSMVFHT